MHKIELYVLQKIIFLKKKFKKMTVKKLSYDIRRFMSMLSREKIVFY